MATRRKKAGAPKRRARKTPAPPATAEEDALPEVERKARAHDTIVAAAKDIKGWAPAADVLDVVTSVATVMPDFNLASGVGGLPVRRIATIHGPSAGGKTAFALGLVKSFVDAGYLAGYVDAEHALGRKFAAELIADLADRPNFLASRPESYEQTIEASNAFLSRAEKIRKDWPEHKAILVVDSINKLVPERELKKILKEGADEIAKGHHGRYRAALNQAWLDQLTPRLARAECALVLIAQERDDPDDWLRDSFKVKGGQALIFDASMVVRISKAAPIFLNPAEKNNDGIVGFAHRVRIWKSKVGHMDGRHTDCSFHLSNGKLTPPGLDTARDALMVGIRVEAVKQTGGWYSYRGRRVQGIHKAVEYLGRNPLVLRELLEDIAARAS